MSIIDVKLFNTPYVMKDNEKITFPFMKAEALFYYLVVNKQATRDELVALFWRDSSDKTAKKNLRNAMYKIRKAFDMDIIISPQKSTVMLNPNIELKHDLELFLYNDNDYIKIYNGEFLHGFTVRNAEGFEDWLFHKRQYYKDIYISKLFNSINTYLSNNDYVNTEVCAKLIIAEDEFDERPYRILMKIYNEMGVYNKAIETYNRLEKLLKNELSIKPDIKTKNIIDNIIKNRRAKNVLYANGIDTLFYGREKEIDFLIKNYNFFQENMKFKSIIIRGEAGIGKTRLKEKFKETIENDKVYLLETNCYQAEKGYFLKPWNQIISKLASIINAENINIPLAWRKMISYLFPVFGIEESIQDKNPVEVLDTLKFSIIEEGIHGVIKKVIKKRKIILIFEDLQWIDDLSLSLLSNILHRNNNVMLICTCRDGHYKKIDSFITMLKANDLIDNLDLRRFTKLEVEDFIDKYLKEHKINNEMKVKIFNETEGNTFFLIEYLNMIKDKGDINNFISPKMKDILKSKFIDVSEEGKKILNIAAIFFDKVTLNEIKELSGKDELDIVEIMEELNNKSIINEISEEEISYTFSHQKLREYVYNDLSSAKRRVLHYKAGESISKSLRNDRRDVSLYPKLLYHYSNSGNTFETLKYTIRYLDLFLDIKHELFPIVTNGNLDEPDFKNMSRKKVVKYFNDIEGLFSKLNRTITKEDIINLEIAYLHIKGRYLIREGKYEEGKKYIENMINKSLSINSFKYALKGYRQNIYYSIQAHDVNFMIDNIDKALEIALKQNVKEDIGILLRLKGLNQIMMEKYVDAEELLEESIRIFNSIDTEDGKYALNIAACYNYIGEIRRHNMEFNRAINYYDKAMRICEDKKLLIGLTIFNTNAGQAAFEKGDYIRAKEYFNKAIEIYEQIDTLWGRSTAEGFLALINCKEGKYDLALKRLKNAEYYSEKLKSPLEIGKVYRVKAEIKANMKNNEQLKKVFSQHLDLSLNNYCDIAMKYLGEVNEGYEIEILKALNK